MHSTLPFWRARITGSCFLPFPFKIALVKGGIAGRFVALETAENFNHQSTERYLTMYKVVLLPMADRTSPLCT